MKMSKLFSLKRSPKQEAKIPVILISTLVVVGGLLIAAKTSFIPISWKTAHIISRVIIYMFALYLLVETIIRYQAAKKNTINAEKLFRKTIKSNIGELSNVVTQFSDYDLLELFLEYQKRTGKDVLDCLFSEMKKRGLFDDEDNREKATQHILKALTHDSIPIYLYDKFIFKKKNPYVDGLLVKTSDIKGIEQTRGKSQLNTKIDVIKVHYIDGGEEKNFNIEPDSMSKWLSVLDSMGLEFWGHHT